MQPSRLQDVRPAEMSQADHIRAFAIEHYLSPARRRRQAEVTVRAGDVHRAMGLSNAMPNVCSALGGKAFLALANVSLLERQGPRAGANVSFRYQLNQAGAPSKPRVTSPSPPPRLTEPQHPKPRLSGELSLEQAVVLVSCVKSKRSRPAPARDLYTSALFSKIRHLVEAQGARWFILSALHGLMDPADIIAPYERTLLTMGVADRRRWAAEVLEALLPRLRDERRVVMFAGARYREFLIGPLQRKGLEIVVPMAGLRLGEQLAWLESRT